MAELVKELLPALDNIDRALGGRGARTRTRSWTGCASCATACSRRSRASASSRSRPPASPSIPPCTRRWSSSPVEGVASGTVAEVYQPGYRLGDQVIRPARVVVAA